MHDALAIINLLPFLLSAVMIVPQTRVMLKQQGMTWLAAGVMGVLFIWLLTYLPHLEEEPYIALDFKWVPDLGLTLAWYLDGLALFFALIVTGIGFVVFLYAGYYMETPDELARFYIYLAAFAGAMLALVTAGNVVTLFIAWELTSITSFLLIGFKGDKSDDARVGASRALVITGAGGLALLVGLLLMGTAVGSFQMKDILTSTSLVDHEWYSAITVLIMIGCFTKSAQFPFHFWLPGAMSAPSPASAYLHSATMVKAGIYLLFRFYPILGNTDLWTHGLLFVGCTTMFIGALFAIRQRDLKGLLAYTTISKLGTLVALIALPDSLGLKAALVGILAHALYKGTLFLLAGVIEHATGTRNLDHLGGLRKYMPGVTVVAVVVGLSMAGFPPLLGFVAKETLLDAMLPEGIVGSLPLVLTVISSILMILSAGLFVWEVFFARMGMEYDHFHTPPVPMVAGPGLLALLSVVTALFIGQTVEPLIHPALAKEPHLHLLPTEFNIVTQLSVLILTLGPLLFFGRKIWLNMPWFKLPTGMNLYAGVIRVVERAGDLLLRSQGGRLRHYLVYIMVVVAGLMFFGGYDNVQTFSLEFHDVGTDLLKIVLLVLTIGATVASILFKNHLLAALAMGVSGYTIGGIFLLEPAPDVALVQFLVETLATVLIILMITRINTKQREEATRVLWLGARTTPAGIYRDAIISVIIGGSVSLFALAAVNDRQARVEAAEPVAVWHIDNAYPQTHVTDVVSAIVTDFRGTDTLIEITVFGMAALGVLTVLTLPKTGSDLLSGGKSVTQVMQKVAQAKRKSADILPEPSPDKMDEYGAFGDANDIPRLATPLTSTVARLVLPFAMLVAFSHILYGADNPGDGFTAGVVGGLAIALWYVVFGYFEARARLRWLRPGLFISAGILLAVSNALAGFIFGGGFLYPYQLGDGKGPAGLHLTSTLLFEIAIFLTVFGGVTMIMAAIAHPEEADEAS